MAFYTKRYAGGFTDLPSQTTAIDATFLNNVESSLLRVDGTGATAGQVPISTGTVYTPGLIKTANIDPVAGILKSQLASLGLVDADVAVGAAIAPSKIANGIAFSQLSGYPSDATKFARGDGSWAAPTTASQLDFKSLTANTATITATSEGSSTTVIAGNSVTFDGSTVRVEVFLPNMISTAGSPKVVLVLFRDATAIGQMYPAGTLNAATTQSFLGATFDTPSAGAHTYKLTAFTSVASTSFVVQAGTGATGVLVPAFLRVTKAA